MKSVSFIIPLVLIASISCKTPKKSVKSDDSVIETIGTNPVYSSEFSYVYNKNNSGASDAYSSASVNDYLRLYTNFKLKVKQAEEMGLDTSKAFKKELDGYKKQLAAPYLTEKGLTDKLTKEAYERMKEEVNASHILILVSPDADPADTLAAYNKLIGIRPRALKGESFEKLAQEYSQDPSAKSNKGNLGYFTALQMVYPFETAAYTTKVGEISMPVRTKFGYHLVKVNNRRPSQGQVKVAHIMVRATTGLPAADSLEAKQKIDEIYSKLKQGEDWNELAAQFSDDVNSKNKGGEITNWISAGKMGIPSFEEAALALQKPGDISAPVQTPYGWHIIKLLERKSLEPYSVLEPSIKTKVNKDRSDVNKIALIQRLKKEDNFVENSANVEKAAHKADSSLLKGAQKFTPITDPKSNFVLFTINGDKYALNDFLAFVTKNQKPRKNISPAQYMRALYKDYQNESIITYEEAHLQDKYPDYRMLVKEYRDGILLFQLMDEKVWSKAIEDTAGLKKFFNEHRENYKWKERAHATIYNAKNQETLDKTIALLNEGKYPVTDTKVQDITFAENKDELTEKDKKELDNILPILLKDKNLVVEITGDAEKKEKKSATRALNRASVARNYLVGKGIDSSSVKAKADTKLAGKKDTFSFYSKSSKALEKYFNQSAPLTLQVTEGLFQKGENNIVDTVQWKPGNYTVAKGGRLNYVVISKIDEPRLKTFEEARGLAISDYQSYLESEWIKTLRAKYPVTVNEEEVKKIVKK